MRSQVERSPKQKGNTSEATFTGSSFNLPNPNHVPRLKEQEARDSEVGRPLWLSETSK